MDDGKILYILRGLPWTGKSFTARQLLQDHADAGQSGVIFSTDEYWYTVLKPDRPDEYSFNLHFLADAHRWNRVRTQAAIEQGVTPVIVDNTNTTGSEARPYVRYALPQDYEVWIQEPTSPRWAEIRELLRDKRQHKAKLKAWAVDLAAGSRETHNVPFFAIERMMWRWQNDLTVGQILDSPERSDHG